MNTYPLSTPESVKSDDTLKPWVVTTKTDAVWMGFARASDFDDLSRVHLRGARNAYYWVASKGIGSLSSSGPEAGSKIGDRCDVILTDTHAWHPCSLLAVAAWVSAGWA